MIGLVVGLFTGQHWAVLVDILLQLGADYMLIASIERTEMCWSKEIALSRLPP